MSDLASILLTPANRDQVLAECVEIIDQRVSAGGLLIRATYSALGKLSPGFTRRATEKLLPAFCDALDPLYQQFRLSGDADFTGFLLANDAAVVDRLLSVTDRRVDGIDNSVVRGAYVRLRPRAETEVHAALPAIAEMTARRVQRA